MYGTALGLRSYGPQSSEGVSIFDSLADSVVEFHLTGASRKFDSYAGNRGYSMALGTFTEDLEQSVYAVAIWTLLTGVVGANPADPAHAALAKAHDDAIGWWRDIGRGIANPGGAPTGRLAHATIGIFSPDCTGGGEGPRGW